MNELATPASLTKAGWIPQYHYATETAIWPEKRFGVAKLSTVTDAASLYARGITHIEQGSAGTTADGLCRIPKWNLARHATGAADMDSWADSMYVGNYKEMLLTQIIENGSAGFGCGDVLGTDYATASRAFYRFYQRLQSDFGLTSPNQTGLFGEYGGDDFVGRTPMLPRLSEPNSKFELFRWALASQDNARQGYNPSNADFSAGTHPYFTTQGGYDSRNWNLKIYLGYNHVRYKQLAYWLLWEIQHRYMAASDRLLATITWTGKESVGDWLDKVPLPFRLRFDALGGDIISGYVPAMSWEEGFTIGLLCTLIADDLHLWEDTGLTSPDLDRWSHLNRNGSVEWQADGQGIQTWTGGSGQPPSWTGGGAVFPRYPFAGEDGQFAGRWVACQLRYYAASLFHPEFTYQTNNGAIRNGYGSSAQPKTGNYASLPAAISRFGVRNEGQDNVVTQFQYQRPIPLMGTGSSGACFLYKNPHLRHTDTDTVRVTHNGVQRTFTCQGPGWHIFRGTW